MPEPQRLRNNHPTTTSCAHSARMPIFLEQKWWRRRESNKGPLCGLTTRKHSKADGIARVPTPASGRTNAVELDLNRHGAARKRPHSDHRFGGLVGLGEGRAYIAAPACTDKRTSVTRLVASLAILATLPACSDAALGWSVFALLIVVLGGVLAITCHRLWRWDAELSLEWACIGARGQAERSALRIPRLLRASYLARARRAADGGTR